MKFLKSWLLLIGLSLSVSAFAQFPADVGDDKYQPRLDAD
jgi:hypothetical protein